MCVGLDRRVDLVCDGSDEVRGFAPLRTGGWASDDEAVGADWDEECVNIVWEDMVPALDPGPCSRSVCERERSAWGDSDIDVVGVSGRAGEGDDVFTHGWTEVDLVDGVLDCADLVSVDNRLEFAEHGLARTEFEQVLFALGVGVSERDAHEEAVELVFWEWVGPDEVVGVLGCDDHEGFGEVVLIAVHGDLSVAHGFEERGLGSGAGPIDLVGEDHAREERAFLESHFTRVSGEDGVSEDICGHHVGGELDAGE